MTKDFSNNLEGFIRLVLLLFSFNCFSQVLPSTIGVHHKKESETQINYALAFVGNGDRIEFSTATSSINNNWSAEVWYKKTAQKKAQNFTNYATSGNAGQSNRWSLRLSQWENQNRIGITQYSHYCCDWFINDEDANTSIGKWEHVAWTYSGNNKVKIYVNGEYIGNYFTEYGNNKSARENIGAAKLWRRYIGYTGNVTIRGEIDEVRFWNDTRTSSEINDNMFIELNGDEAGLASYYKMSNGTGTTLTDNSSNPKYNGKLKSMGNNNWVTSYAPIGDIDDDYKNSIEAIWAKTGSEYSSKSNGLFFKLNDELTEQNFAVFGSNSSAGTNTNNLPSGTVIKSSREWQIDENGRVQANVFIDISEATGNTVTPATASNYKLIYKNCASCYFSIEESGDNISNSDWIKFENVSLKDGYYAIASTDTEL